MVQGLINNLQQVFDAMNIGVIIETADRTIAYANKKVLESFGVDVEPHQIVGNNTIDIAKEFRKAFIDPEKILKNVNDVPAGIEAKEETLQTVSGKFLLRKYTPIKGNDGVTHHLWTYEDVTELMEKQNQLRSQRAFLEKVLNEIPADIAIFSPDHKYLFVNKMGIHDEEVREWIIGKDDYEYVAHRGYDKSIADTRRARFNQAKSAREAVSWVDEIPTSNNGAMDYILRIYYPYINAQDELELMIGYGVNITDQKRKEQEVAQAKERFSSMVSSLKDGVFQCDFQGNIITSNDTIMTMVDEVVPIEEGKPVNIFAIVHDEDIGNLMAGADELKRTKMPQRGVVRLKPNKHGDIKYVDSYVWLQQDVDRGEVFTGRISDITEQMLKQEQMKKVIEKEKDLNELKSNFIHITSHELRTPLSVVLSSAEILDMILSMKDEDRPEGVDPKQFTDSIVKEVRNITDILNEMLMVSRIEKGKIQFRPEPIDLGYYLNAIAEEQYSPYEDGRTLNVDVQLKDAKAFIDIKLMRHAVANLINNAFKYSAGKEAPILKASNCQDGGICIEVTDHGIGIPECDREMLFNSFFRASNVGNISGNGIGLMVVDHVMKVHGGKVEVKSEVNQGTTFTLVIPNK